MSLRAGPGKPAEAFSWSLQTQGETAQPAVDFLELGRLQFDDLVTPRGDLLPRLLVPRGEDDVVVEPDAVGAVLLLRGHQDPVEPREGVARRQLPGHDEVVAPQIGHARLEVQE